jgi:hypothetical protein
MMKYNSFLISLIALTLLSCQSKPELKDQEQIYLAKRDFIMQDSALKEKPLFVPLPAGAVVPEGWIRDGAELAAQGITGHLDEWTITHRMAWKGVGFKARGADSITGMGWPLEQSSYWLDGAVRLAYMLNDTALIHKISDRLNIVVDGVLAGGKSFVYWRDVDYSKTTFNNWAHSHMGRALVAYYEASGDKRVLEALTKVYGQFALVNIPHHTWDVSGCNNVDPMIDTYVLSGDRRILQTLRSMAASDETKETVRRWNEGDCAFGHGVIIYENLRIPAMLAPLANDPSLLNATLSHLKWLDDNYLLPFGIASSEEFVAGIGSTRNTETCNVSCSSWTYQQLYEIMGDGHWGDRIEQVFFNATPAPAARDYKTMAYYQSPNRVEGLMPFETPGAGSGSFDFHPTGHGVLCCVGNLTRSIPNYIMYMWMGTIDKGLAATLYGPSVVDAVVLDGIPVRITSETNYPFEEDIRLHVEPYKTCTFPLYLRIPAWCSAPEVRVNDENIDATHSESGFIRIERQWKKGDRISIRFPMQVQIVDGRETAYPQERYFLDGKQLICKETNINSPYRTVYYGPLLFTLPIKDLNCNVQAPDQKWNYAMVSDAPASIEVVRSEMPSHWTWQIDETPIKLIAKATEFDWVPTAIAPLPSAEVQGNKDVDITLVPYGCTKFRITMFPVTKK